MNGDGVPQPADLMHAARAETRLDHFGDDAFREGLEVLGTDRGEVTIRGESLSTFMVLGPLAGFALHQSIVRYTWDGETANGMMERSRAAGQ